MEIWKSVSGYEGLYEVSNYGRVRSMYRYKKILKPMICNSGYERVDLFKGGERKQFSVHRLVAIAFIDNQDEKPFVNHKDENKLNNRADNLEWVTREENCRYGSAIKRRVKNTDYTNRKIDRKKQKKAVSKPISQFKKSGEYVRDWDSATECSKHTGFSISGIRAVVRGKRSSIYGYVFKEKKEVMTYR